MMDASLGLFNLSSKFSVLRLTINQRLGCSCLVFDKSM